MSQNGFQLKASSLTFTSFILFSPNLDIIEAQLSALVAKTPNFFDATPVLLDLTTIEMQDLPFDLIQLIALLKRYRLNPIGVKSHCTEHKETAKAQNLAIIAQTETAVEKIAAEAKPEAKPATPSIVTAKIIDQPVRSGKQIYAKGCDLIITAPVSHGAEVIADGNIHLYSTLHGRALAGAQGNLEAKIFCRKLEAELIAIAGHYLVSEQIPESHKNGTQVTEIFLENNKLQFRSL